MTSSEYYFVAVIRTPRTDIVHADWTHNLVVRSMSIDLGRNKEGNAVLLSHIVNSINTVRGWLRWCACRLCV